MEDIQNATNKTKPINHSHKTREEQKLCALWFGECWQNPSRIESIREKTYNSNKPPGTYPPDQRFE